MQESAPSSPREGLCATCIHARRVPNDRGSVFVRCAYAAIDPDLALKAAKGGQTHEAFLYDLVQCECVQRDERRIARLLHRSGLPQEKTFATLALDRFPLAVRQQIERLQSGTFVEEAINVIAVGRPLTTAVINPRRRIH